MPAGGSTTGRERTTVPGVQRAPTPVVSRLMRNVTTPLRSRQDIRRWADREEG